MRIAVIGGGASGLCAAYRLQDRYDVHLFEKQDRLGGNIGTLNGNLRSSGLPENIRIETGVLGFHQQSYPTVHRFFDELGVAQTTKQPTSALFLGDAFLPSDPQKLANPAVLARLLTRPSQRRHVLDMRSGYLDMFRRIVRRDGLPDASLQELRSGTVSLDSFVQSLASLAFSTPEEMAGELPASLVGPYLGATRYPDWTALQGGVWSYVEALLARSKFKISTGVLNISVSRSPAGVRVRAGGETLAFDEVVIATTPGQVLKILSDPSDAEYRLFQPWADHKFKTVAHTSDAVYGKHRKLPRTPMDLFVDDDGQGFGYNTYMNDFYDLPGRVPYAFSYNLDDRIPDEAILHTEDHIVPTYTKPSTATIEDIWSMNGRNGTWFCGAYLGGGLHEGAISSAYRVAEDMSCEARRADAVVVEAK